MRIMKSYGRILTVLALLGCLAQSPANAIGYDLDNGNAAFEIVILTAAPVIFREVSPSGGDATLVLRVTTMITNSWFDATAPYHETAVGVYTGIDRQWPAGVDTNYNMNVALLYASHKVLNSLLPRQGQIWDAMLSDVGLDPTNDSTDTTTPEGIGNVAGLGVVIGRQNDGMNQLGYEGGRTYNPMPYMDYTGYEPVNTPWQLFDPSRWQPDLQRQGMGIYKIQKFVTPQYAYTEPYSYPDPTVFEVPPPENSNHQNLNEYKRQAKKVLKASARLNDKRKLKAELFDNKIESLGFSAVFAAQSRGLSLMEFIHLDFLTNMAAYDAGIVIWQEKQKYDAVRPFSAIRYLYGDQPVRAWGGPGLGTVDDLPASEWKSYLEEADHPEYPSASTCFCTAHAQAARLYLGSDDLNWEIPKPAGSSRIEPGITPAADTVLKFKTWTDFAEDCGQSRVWAGVHFQAAVDESEALCNVFGNQAFDYFSELVNGTAPVRPPSTGSYSN